MHNNLYTQELQGKTAIITGAARGIGRAIALTLAAHGVHVVIADILDEQGATVAAEITAEGGSAIYRSTDIGETDAIHDLIESTQSRDGRLDIIVNNAYWSVRKNVLDLDEAEWDRSMDVTLKAIFLTGKYGFPHMIAQGGGVMVNIASIHGYAAQPNYPVYAAAKAGVINLTQQMAIDMGPHNIRINAVCPGWIKATAEPLAAEERERTAALYPVGREGRPEEIANVVLFLVSPQSSFVHGHALVADGGLTAQLPDSAMARTIRR